MSISNYLELALLDEIFNGVNLAPPTPRVSLHSADPGETGASELSGGGYARLAGSWGAAAAGQVATDADLNWTNLPAATVTHVGIWDAASAGNFLWGGPLLSPRVVSAGDDLSILAGDLVITLD